MSESTRTLDPATAAQSVAAWLAFFRRVIRRRLALDGVARLLAAAVGLVVASFLLDRLFRLSLPARLTLVGVGVAGLGTLAWAWLVRPLRMRLDPLTIAAALDGGTGELTARVGTVLHLAEQLNQPAPPSAAMVGRAVQRAHAALAAVNLRSRLNDRRRNLAVAAGVVAMLIPATLAIAAPAAAGLWARRMLLGRNDPWPQKTYLEVVGLPADRTIVVPRGEPFVLKVRPRPGSAAPPAVWLRYREAGGGRVDGGFTAFGPGDFRYDFAAVDATVTATVWGGDDTPDPFTIRPADRPRVTDLQLVAQHPTDPKPTTYTFGGGDAADLSFLPQTKLQLLVTANVPVASLKLTGSPATVAQTDPTHFTLGWTQATATSLHLELTGRDAGLVSVPTDVTVGLKRDQPPRVTVAFTGVKARVTPSAHIPLTVDARDDYAVVKVRLTTKAESPDPADPARMAAVVASSSLFDAAPGEADVPLTPTVDVASLHLGPGSLLTVSATATDNCYAGPQTTTSRSLVFRIVPPEELFREILLRQQSDRARFRRQTDEAAALAEAMGGSPPATAEAAAAIAHRHRAVQRDVARTLTSLSDTLTEMKLNELGTAEAHELMRRNIIAPLHELAEGPLNQQKDALDALRPNDPAAWSAAHDRQRQIADGMAAVLKQMSQWDSFVDVLNQLNEVIRLQGQAQQTTSQLKRQDTEGLFEK